MHNRVMSPLVSLLLLSGIITISQGGLAEQTSDVWSDVIKRNNEAIVWFDDDPLREAVEVAKKSSRSLPYPKNPARFRKFFCIQPHWSCQSNPEGCCEDYTCRCNLFGTNCRCMRLGIFQRFG